MKTPGPISTNYRESFKICREELNHEYGVLSSRLTSYITSQSFLVSAFAVAMNNVGSHWTHEYRLYFPVLLVFVGVSLSARAHPGIKGVCQIIHNWHVRQNKLFETSDELDDWEILRHEQVASVNERNLWFAQTSSWIFGIAWILMGVIAIWAYLHG
jgi:hypothetical protein